LAPDEWVTITPTTGVQVELVGTGGKSGFQPAPMQIKVEYGPTIVARFHVARLDMFLIQQAHREKIFAAIDASGQLRRIASDTSAIASLIRDALVKTEHTRVAVNSNASHRSRTTYGLGSPQRIEKNTPAPAKNRTSNEWLAAIDMDRARLEVPTCCLHKTRKG